MARLWTDVIDPETLSDFARRSLQEYEAARGSLARWLPNKEVADQVVRFFVGQNGLVEEARYRAFDAEPEFGEGPKGKRRTVDLPALSQQGVISERDQLRLRSADDEVRQRILLDGTRNAVFAIADRVERQRGSVLVTGKAVIDQDNYADEADFGRDSSLGITASTLWTLPAAERLSQIETWVDHYTTMNGVAPATMLVSTRVLRAIAAGEDFAALNADGSVRRRATRGDVEGLLSGAGLPPIEVYDRSTKSGKVIPDDRILFLPEAVDPDGGDSELGATFWGQTLASSEPEWAIAESEQPGIVAAAFTHEGIPPIRHTYADSISLPVGANMNLAMAVKVL